MTRLLFWDVDTLYDFMRADGRLYVPDSEAIIPTLAALTAFAHVRGIPIVASASGLESYLGLRVIHRTAVTSGPPILRA